LRGSGRTRHSAAPPPCSAAAANDRQGGGWCQDCCGRQRLAPAWTRGGGQWRSPSLPAACTQKQLPAEKSANQNDAEQAPRTLPYLTGNQPLDVHCRRRLVPAKALGIGEVLRKLRPAGRVGAGRQAGRQLGRQAGKDGWSIAVSGGQVAPVPADGVGTRLPGHCSSGHS
jgi:hypothetical protein